MVRARAVSAAIRALFAGALVVFIAALLGKPIAFAVPMSGAIALIVFALGASRRSPDDYAIAAHIDHDRNLHELLASSLSTGEADDAASVSLRAMASDAASRLRAEDVRVDAPSPRWAVAALLVLGASIITSALIAPPVSGSTLAGNIPDGTSVRASSAAGAKTALGAHPAAAASEAETKSSQAVAAPSGDDASKIAAEMNTNARSTQSDRSDAGAARGQTADASQAQLAFDALKQSSTPSRGSPAAAASGQEGVGDATSADSESTAGKVERSQITAAAGAIDATAHESARANASAALNAGTVPSRCRDLVRVYFDIDTPASLSIASPSGSK